MNRTFRRVLVIVAVVAVTGLVLAAGTSALAGIGGPVAQPAAGPMLYGRGMMNSGMMGGGMMGYTGTMPYGPGLMGGGMMGMMSRGMMGLGSTALTGVKPLSLDKATTTVKDYLARLGNSDLAVDEVMIFDNNAYARIVEKSTGIGAFEVLVDPVTLAVFPEPGPNMMWNTKYGHMRSGGIMGMMGGTAGRGASTNTNLPASAEDAIKAAQSYLDVYLPGAKVEDKADAFYGYYTLDILRDGNPVGMLSVNGYTRQVFPHTWHGNFISVSEDE